MPEAIEGPLADRANSVAADCERIGRALAVRAVAAKRRRTTARSVNVVIGGVAAIVALSSPVANMLGDNGVRIVGILAATVLIFDGLFPVILGDDTPDRLADYSMYIHSYAGILRNTLADEGMRPEARRARLSEVLNMATRNFDDVRARWPWVDQGKPLPLRAPAAEQ